MLILCVEECGENMRGNNLSRSVNCLGGENPLTRSNLIGEKQSVRGLNVARWKIN